MSFLCSHGLVLVSVHKTTLFIVKETDDEIKKFDHIVLERSTHSTYNPVTKQVYCTDGMWACELIIYRNGYQFAVKVEDDLMPYSTCVFTLLNSYEAAVGGGLIHPTNTVNGVAVRQLMENAIRTNKIV